MRWNFRLSSDLILVIVIVSFLCDQSSARNKFKNGGAQVCPSPQLYEIKTELNIPDLYKEVEQTKDEHYVSFLEQIKDDPFRITGNSSGTNGTKGTQEKKLKVFVVLHSHNDAGWGQTFEGYYESRTKAILDNILHYLTLDPELKFSWSETSFFDLWWRGLPSEKRKQVKRLVESKQLEFVGGGWVMQDEATTHYSSMTTQLMEGHQWLQQHLNFTPRNGWAVDPFGLSSTSNYLLRQSGLKNTVFSRIHYKLLELLKKKKSTEFYWRQPWDSAGKTDMFCYQMPYGTYDLGSTCGPDHDYFGICKIYSFDRAIAPDRYEHEIQNRSLVLLNQYRKKSLLFRTNNVLLPIGKDFSWQTDEEWQSDIRNLKDIFKYINSDKSLNTEIKFTTLDEYFEAVHADERNKKNSKMPVFSGDFYTYADNAQDYWSGYFTSRIFHKASERQLMALVRSAQLIYTMMAAEISKTIGNQDFNFIPNLLQKIVESRRVLSLFQHHDGITGTSTDLVVQDYSVKLFYAMHNCHFVIQQCIHILQNIKKEQLVGARSVKDGSKKDVLDSKLKNITTTDSFYVPVKNKSNPSEIWKDRVIQMDHNNPEERIVVFNSLAKTRKQLVRVSVSSSNVKVLDANNFTATSEIYPVFKYYKKYKNYSAEPYLEASKEYELHFIAKLRPLEIKTFTIVYDKKLKKRNRSRVRVQVFNTKTQFSSKFNRIFEISTKSNRNHVLSNTKTIQITNHYLKINFDSNGTAKHVEMDGTFYPLSISFPHYSTYSSGLYVFTPDGSSKPMDLGSQEPLIIVVKGKLRSYVEVWYPTVRHRVTLLNHDGLEGYGIDVENTVDIRRENNYELIMKMETGIKSKAQFFTDSNGFQMMRRNNHSTFPIQANYYPMATAAFIEDADLRMTLLAAQPGGVSSLTSGQLQVMLDRKVLQDDYKGIDQGGTDNLLTVLKFKIILEKVPPECQVVNNNDNRTEIALPLLSLETNLQQLNLLHPLLIYSKTSTANSSTSDSDSDSKRHFDLDLKVKSSALSCDVHLLGAMPLPQFTDSEEKNDTKIFMTPSTESALLFHRMGIDRRFTSGSTKLTKECLKKPKPFGNVNIKDIFGDLFKSMRRASLTLSNQGREFDLTKSLSLELMEIYSFIGRYSGKYRNGTMTNFKSLMPTISGATFLKVK